MKHLLLGFDEGIASVTLNRPEVRNAFNDEVIAELLAVFMELGNRSEVRAVVLAANGPAFCAGADLNWMRRRRQAHWRQAPRHAPRCDCPVP